MSSRLVDMPAGSCSGHWSWKGSRSRSGHGQLSQEGSIAWGKPSAHPTRSAGRLGSRAEKKGGVGKQPPNCFSRPGPLPRVLEARVPRTGHRAALQHRPGRRGRLSAYTELPKSIPGAAGLVGAEHLGCGFKVKLSRQSAYTCVSCRSFGRDGLGVAPSSLCSLLGRAPGPPVRSGCQAGPGQVRSASSIGDGDHCCDGVLG